MVRTGNMIANSFRWARDAWTNLTRPRAGALVRPDAQLDFVRAAVSDNLTFSRLRTLLISGDNGDLETTLQLFAEMRQKDLNLRSVADTRIGALTGLDYEILPESDTKESQLAEEAAAFVREGIKRIAGFDETLEHLAEGIGTNLSVAETVWGENDLVEALTPVPHWRLRSDTQKPGLVLVATHEAPRGEAVAGPKWIVHEPYFSGGHPLSQSLYRSSALIYLVKMLAVADYATYCETYGMPMRVAKYPPGISTDERTALINMMENLGSKAYGVFSQGVELDLHESSQRGTQPFEALINLCDRSMAKLWLGGNLTSDTTGGTGTFAAAAVQDDVREDKLDDDIRREARTIEAQLFAPMCLYHFRRPVPLPKFRRTKPDTTDRNQLAQLLNTVTQQMGLPVAEEWAYDALGIPKPEEGEAVIERNLGAFGETLQEETDSGQQGFGGGSF
ncbi:MAG: DUF935 family protein [Phycisphaerae bacterium]|nr:DUF935 family protein [Phycisphaerae bacterium]